MYRRKNKQNKSADFNTVNANSKNCSKSGKSIFEDFDLSDIQYRQNLPNTSKVSNLSLNESLNIANCSDILPTRKFDTSINNQNNQSLVLNSTARKRKSLFDDFDFSDLKVDQNYPSFLNASKVQLNETDKMQNTDKLLNLEDIDFEEDILLEDNKKILDNVPPLNKKHKASLFDDVDLTELDFDQNFFSKSTSNPVQNNKTCSVVDLKDIDFDEDILIDDNKSKMPSITVEDQNEMMSLVKNNLITEPNNKNNKNNQRTEESFSQLLDDDDFDDEDFDIESELIKLSNPENNTDNDCPRFQTANGRLLPIPDENSLLKAKNLFQDIESLLIKEMAGYLYSQKSSKCEK